MANILPVSDLRNYNEVLKNCHKGEPVYLTKNGRGRFVVMDIEDYERDRAEKKLLLKLRAEIGLAGSFLLFLLFRNVNTGYLGFGNWNILKLPDGFYENLFTTYLGFPQKGFFSADYFSLLPWFFLFLTGFYLYQLVQKNHMMEKLFSWGVPGFDVIGRHSLLIYLLHQPVVFGISWMLFQI